MSHHPWTAAELGELEALAGTLPWPLFPQHWNRWATANGFPARTAAALRSRLRKLGHTTAPDSGEWFTTGQITEIAGLGRGTAESWVRRYRGILRPAFRKRYYIHRRRLHALAREHPRLFGGIDPEPLAYLIGDETLAQQIAEQFTARPRGYCPHARAVKCMETRVVYPSQLAAARAVYVVPSAIHWAITTGRPIAGFHWKRA